MIPEPPIEIKLSMNWLHENLGKTLFTQKISDYRWSPYAISQLIQDIYFQIPIPPIYLLYDKVNQIYQILKGDELIKSIVSFINSRTTTSGMHLMEDLNGLNYSQLCRQDNYFKKHFEEYSITAYIYEKSTVTNNILSLIETRR